MDPSTAEATLATLKIGAAVIAVIKALGPWGLLLFVLTTNLAVPLAVLVMWFVNARRQDALIERYRDDMLRSLNEHGEALETMSRYYRDNVDLVRSWERIANGLQDVVLLNTQAMQRMSDRVDNNLWCPVVRDKVRGSGA